MQKYSNELKYIINYYNNQEKKRNFFKQKALKSMSKNMNLMRKMQEVFIDMIIYLISYIDREQKY